MLPAELQHPMDEDPRLKITLVKPTAPQIIGALVDGLNNPSAFVTDTLTESKHHEVVLNHTFWGLSEEVLNEVLDHLTYFNFAKLKTSAYSNLLLRIPNTSCHYGRIKGNMMFELCRHTSYDKALEKLGIKNV